MIWKEQESVTYSNKKVGYLTETPMRTGGVAPVVESLLNVKTKQNETHMNGVYV
jgi:hypothetical protein